LIDDGISVAVAAGNDGIDTCNDSPARVEAAITVAATTPTDGVASFSNWGDCNDIFAPGVDIRSASPASNTATAVGAGTSMAAPHVAGAAALILGSAPSLGPAEVKQLLESTSTSGALTGRRSGEPDRLLHATTVPGVPDAPTVLAGDRTVTVSWVAPRTYGSPIVSYLVEEPGGGACQTTGQLTCTVTGLSNGQTYSFVVTASNAVGPSPPSPASATVSPQDPSPPDVSPPEAPTGLTVVPGDRSVTVSWHASADNGSAVISYRAWTDAGECTTSALSCTVTGLANGTSYAFRVEARNGEG
jgi:subtilisin family serine protease